MKKTLLLSICAMFCASAAFAADTTTPLTVSSGFNIDAITVSQADAPTAAGPIDGHGSQFIVNVFPGLGGTLSEGVPVDGKLTTTGGHAYQLGNYVGNNCFYIGITATNSSTLGTPTSGTVAFSNPTAGNKLGILMAGTNRDSKDLKFNLKVTYQNGTTSDLGSFKVSDWGQNNESDAVFTFTKRYRADASSNPEMERSTCQRLLQRLTIPLLLLYLLPSRPSVRMILGVMEALHSMHSLPSQQLPLA